MSTKRPNFLLFITDQQRADHLGCYGNPLLRTPNIDSIAVRGWRFERFYVADLSDLLPDRLLDLNTDRRPAPNFFGTSIAEVRFGDYAAKIQGEHRIPIYRGSRSVYGIDFFSALGLYAVAEKRDITDPARGYSGLARIPIDFTFNLGLRMDTNAGGFVFALANPLGFVPVLRGRP